MRNVERLLGIAAVVFACAPSCATKQSGQLMLAIQTDMSLPKDIDRVRIEVTHADSGSIIFAKDFARLGSEESIRLPATLGITAPEGASAPVRIRVIATHGADDAVTVKVLREVVTTIPTDRTATLPISLEFLCNGSGEVERDQYHVAKRDSSGEVIVKNTCPDQQTCLAGVCAPSAVPSENLPEYAAEKIFGGGTGKGDGSCFDTAACFENSAEAALDLDGYQTSKVCKALVTGDVNIALRTQGGGICGKTACFVALDADGPSGWTASDDGKVVLPPGVCAKFLAGEVVGLVTAPVQGKCQKKQSALPTCGPWSSSGDDGTVPDTQKGTPIAPGQINPVTLAIAGESVVWTNRGTFTGNNANQDGTVKIVSFDGGQPQVIASGQASPHDIAAEMGSQFLLWTNAVSGEIMWASFVNKGVTPVGKQLVGGILQPEGIAVSRSYGVTGDNPKLPVYWTELATNQVFRLDATVTDMGALDASGLEPSELPPFASATSPRAIASIGDDACWTYEAKLGTSEGVVACVIGGQSVTIATQQDTPRSIVISGDAKATSVYWASFAKGGGISKVVVANGVPGAPSKFAEADYPAGLAIDPSDSTRLYWTTRSSEGAVWTQRAVDTKSTLVADGQLNPGSIAVTEKYVFWINEGATSPKEGAVPDGAIMKIAK